MTAPINNLSLEDLNFYLDERLSRVNVYQFTFVSPDIEDMIADIIQMSQKFSCNQMIQQSGIDFYRVTFVSHVSCHFFYQYIDRLVTKVSSIHKSKCIIL